MIRLENERVAYKPGFTVHDNPERCQSLKLSIGITILDKDSGVLVLIGN